MANTMAGRRVYVCADPQQNDLDQFEFAALAWTQVRGVGSFGETGENTNLLTYDTWDTDVTLKGKGITDAGSPELEVARLPSDAGQVILRTAARTNLNYAVRIDGNDYPDDDPDSTPTVRYNRGLIVGPRVPNGRNEDFDLEIFTFGLNQRQVTVDPLVGGLPFGWLGIAGVGFLGVAGLGSIGVSA